MEVLDMYGEFAARVGAPPEICGRVYGFCERLTGFCGRVSGAARVIHRAAQRNGRGAHKSQSKIP